MILQQSLTGASVRPDFKVTEVARVQKVVQLMNSGESSYEVAQLLNSGESSYMASPATKLHSC